MSIFKRFYNFLPFEIFYCYWVSLYFVTHYSLLCLVYYFVQELRERAERR